MLFFSLPSAALIQEERSTHNHVTAPPWILAYGTMNQQIAQVKGSHFRSRKLLKLHSVDNAILGDFGYRTLVRCEAAIAIVERWGI
jgi:hypothetical protein